MSFNLQRIVEITEHVITITILYFAKFSFNVSFKNMNTCMTGQYFPPFKIKKKTGKFIGTLF